MKRHPAAVQNNHSPQGITPAEHLRPGGAGDRRLILRIRVCAIPAPFDRTISAFYDMFPSYQSSLQVKIYQLSFWFNCSVQLKCSAFHTSRAKPSLVHSITVASVNANPYPMLFIKVSLNVNILQAVNIDRPSNIIVICQNPP